MHILIKNWNNIVLIKIIIPVSWILFSSYPWLQEIHAKLNARRFWFGFSQGSSYATMLARSRSGHCVCVYEMKRVTSNFSDVMLLDSSRSWFEPEVHGFNALQGHPARFSTHSSWFGWFSASTKIYGLLLRISIENPVCKPLVTKRRSSWNTRVYAPRRSIPQDHISSAWRRRATWV